MPKRKPTTGAPVLSSSASPMNVAGDSQDESTASSPVAAAVAASVANAGPKRSKPAEKERLSYYVRGMHARARTMCICATDVACQDRKLSELEDECEQIKNGTHPELVEKLQAHRAKRDRQVQEAALLKTLRIREVEALHDYQIKEANDVCAATEKEIVERMLAEVEESVKRAKDLRDGTAADAVKKRATPEEGKDSAGADGGGGDEDAMLATTTTTTTTTTMAPIATRAQKPATRATGFATQVTKPGSEFTISFSAPADAIAADLSTIHSEWLAQAQKYLTQAEIQDLNVRIEGGKLFFNEYVFEKGSSIVVVSEANRLTFYGTIKNISNAEVILKTSDGSMNRVLLSHLRSGRAKISPNADDNGKADL